MILDLTKLSYEARWFDFSDGVRLKIRPYPASMSDITIRAGRGVIISGEESLKLFVHCLTGWEGVVGSDEQPLPCTEEVLRKIYDFQLGGIPQFVLTKVREFEAAKLDAEKN